MSHHRRAPSRGVVRRNAKLRVLREVVSRDRAILAVDLAAGNQAAVVLDHDSVVLGRRMFIGSPWCIDKILTWAAPIASRAGFAGVVLGCEPTGHRWKPLVVTARAQGIPAVCVQPLLVHRGREGEDFTRNRSDFTDAVIIGRLIGELRCYIPYLPVGPWARLRHLGARRAQLLVRAAAARQGLRDLIECAWPALLATAAQPLDSATWRAAVAVSLDPQIIAADSLAQFTTRVREKVHAAGGTRVCHAIVRAIHAAAMHPDGIDTERPALAERAGFAFGDWMAARCALAEVESRMIAVLDELELTGLVATIPGLSPVAAAQILAETGDPTRFDCARTWVKHAGLAPRANESGTFHGQTKTSGRGRPGLRTAAWRAIWGALPHNPAWAARHAHLTGRQTNRLVDGQARAAVAAALLRQLFVVVTERVAWDATLATGTTDTGVTAIAA